MKRMQNAWKQDSMEIFRSRGAGAPLQHAVKTFPQYFEVTLPSDFNRRRLQSHLQLSEDYPVHALSAIINLSWLSKYLELHTVVKAFVSAADSPEKAVRTTLSSQRVSLIQKYMRSGTPVHPRFPYGVQEHQK